MQGPGLFFMQVGEGKAGLLLSRGRVRTLYFVYPGQ